MKMRWFVLILSVLPLMYTGLSCVAYRFDQLRQHEAQKDDVALIRFLENSKDGYIRAQAAQSLGRLKSKKAVLSLIKALHDTEWEVRLYSAEALGKIGDPRGVKAIRDHIGREEEEHVIRAMKKV
ncbi:MAG TPA: HEAT repeat domain-containing protein, partial [Spirochaetes bacterium]|nr:HEAT repeat domain-containing protein [Spirochaetota bacterium]